ncbi:MAG: NTP transferase domain-containing protein [Elusimicrobiota bacterium]
MSNINAGIFAAGKGERLKKHFPHTPKPLIKVGNKTLIEYAYYNLLSLNPSSIALLLNTETGEQILDYINKIGYKPTAIMIDSKTSFESFFTLANFLKVKDKDVVLSTVDTITRSGEIINLVKNHNNTSAYITLGVTRVINDEKPLLVDIDEKTKRIKSIGKTGYYATNGIYCLSYKAINNIKNNRYKALREFLSQLDFEKNFISFYNIEESLDIDDISDIKIAEFTLQDKQ